MILSYVIMKGKRSPHSGPAAHWAPSNISVVGSLQICHEVRVIWEGAELHISHTRLAQEPISSELQPEATLFGMKSPVSELSSQVVLTEIIYLFISCFLSRE